MIGIVIGIAIHQPDVDKLRCLMVGVALSVLAAVSIADDVRGASVFLRLAVHFVSASIVVASFGPHVWLFDGNWILNAGTVVFLVWMINLYNFMDGMDGFAGGMAVIGFAAFGCLGWLADSPLFTALSLIVAAAAGGFLLFNFPPARIFMGDAGSSVLGFFAGIFTLWGDWLGIFPLWIGLLVFSPFIVDASVTLLRRLIAGERVWEPHKTHYYQRLVLLGWGHRKTVLFEYAVMLAAALAAIVGAQSSPMTQWLLLAIFVAFYSAAAFIIEALERRAASSG